MTTQATFPIGQSTRSVDPGQVGHESALDVVTGDDTRRAGPLMRSSSAITLNGRPSAGVPRVTRSGSTVGTTSLPFEVIQNAASHLPIGDLTALRQTSCQFRGLLEAKHQELTFVRKTIEDIMTSIGYGKRIPYIFSRSLGNLPPKRRAASADFLISTIGCGQTTPRDIENSLPYLTQKQKNEATLRLEAAHNHPGLSEQVENSYEFINSAIASLAKTCGISNGAHTTAKHVGIDHLERALSKIERHMQDRYASFPNGLDSVAAGLRQLPEKTGERLIKLIVDHKIFGSYNTKVKIECLRELCRVLDCMAGPQRKTVLHAIASTVESAKEYFPDDEEPGLSGHDYINIRSELFRLADDLVYGLTRLSALPESAFARGA